MDEGLWKYFMEQSNKRFDSIDDKLGDLTRFKIEMMASARLTALIVSGICGALTLCATCVATYFMLKKGG